ncbi:uncharacterized protein LOC142524162 [Primulina tabacum]|uniref:uncharacterized protein LOC142524162 n=1 Tax=Primulina tabacum TaxID=48773 RepID=UPI003F5A171D
MENLKMKNWNSVPQFGAWEHEAGVGTNYSMIFSQARANRKQQKNNLTRHIIGNERELLKKTHREDEYGVIDMQKKKKKMWRCLSCCIRF